MAEENTQYRRKISAQESQEGFIMVLKESLKFFPKIDKPFKVKIDAEEFETMVEAYDCWCMGPKKPHMHYRIPIRKFRVKFPLHRGLVITFTRVGDDLFTLTK
jgi:hypothetical protein